MFLAIYESKRVWFDDIGWVIVTRTPYPVEPYSAQLENDLGEPIKAWGDTVLAAIAALNEVE